MDEIKMPGFDVGKPGLKEQHEAGVSIGMSRVLKYIGMTLEDKELMDRGNDDTVFRVPMERERLQKIWAAAEEMRGDGHVLPFEATHRMIDHFASQLGYA